MDDFPNILIVDDTEANLFLLETLIRKLKVRPIRAISGEEALEKSKGFILALAIIDVQMPYMNGYELAKRINEERKGDIVPVIFLTANYFNEVDVFEGYDSGAVDYIFKPLNSRILLSKINVFLELFNQKQIIVKDVELLKESSDELRRVNANLKKSEKKYRSYIDNAPDGVFVTDDTGGFIDVNEATCRMTGYSENEFLGMFIYDILPQESHDSGIVKIGKVFKQGKLNADLSFRHKTGIIQWWTIEAVKLEEKRFLFFAKDITDRKATEDELKSSLEQLHLLTQYIENVRENERVAISRELHDDLGQALTAVKIDLGIIKHHIPDADIISKIDKVSALVGDTIKTVQKITAQLRPEIIDDLGLEAAIEWYTKEFAQRNSVEVFLNIDTDLNISPDATLIVFRIMQESLTNIARHAQATRVELSLNQKDEYIHFQISDNGVGINENELKSKKSFGLISMNERSASLGGVFEISRGNDCGTIIKLIFPKIS